jgi:hypothetical protein
MPDEKRVDQEWKEKVQKEKGQGEPAKQEPKRKAPLADKLETPEAKFTFLVSSLASQALINLGLIENPVSKKNEVDLEGAKFAIDLVQMLADKTRGNLSELEKRYLEGVLYDLRMRFVEASK